MKVTLRWPTSLAVSAVDHSVFIVDVDVVVQLSTAERRLRVLVAAAGTPCLYMSRARRPVVVSRRRAGPLTGVAVTPSARQLVITQRRALRAVHLLTGHVTQYDVPARDNMTLSAVSVDHDGVIFVTDVNNVYTVTSPLPAPHDVTGNYDVMDPSTGQRYTFNRSVCTLSSIH